VETVIRASNFTVLISFFLLTACEESVAPIEVQYQENIQDAIFSLSCLVGCHDSTKRAGLELTTWETLMDGGDIRLVIVPGNAEASPLVWSIEGQNALGVGLRSVQHSLHMRLKEKMNWTSIGATLSSHAVKRKNEIKTVKFDARMTVSTP